MSEVTPPHRRAVILKGTRIREDSMGLLCLNDIYRAAREPKNQAPADWRRLGSVPKLILALYEKTTGKSQSKGKISFTSIIYSKQGRDGGTFAHPILAAAYAAYLSPKLAIEIKEIWLRYRRGDPTLADEILERSTEEGNRWAAARAIGRVQRRRFTDVLQEALCSQYGYSRCTNAIYQKLFDKAAQQIKRERQVIATRDGLEIIELAQVALSEGMAANRITEERALGDVQCINATSIAASFVRDAVDREKASRQRRLDV